MKAENRHYEKVHKKKKHPAAKCRNAKCLICSHVKIMKVKDRQTLRQDSKGRIK